MLELILLINNCQTWEKALSEENVIKNIEGKEILKVIVVPNRIVNIVVK